MVRAIWATGPKRLPFGSKIRLEIADRILCVCRSRTKASLHRDETRRLGCLWLRGLTKRADPIAGAPVASWDVLGLY